MANQSNTLVIEGVTLIVTQIDDAERKMIGEKKLSSRIADEINLLTDGRVSVAFQSGFTAEFEDD